MACKHKHTTIVSAWLDNGFPLFVHQCDMCGLTLPALPTDAALRQAQGAVGELAEPPPPIDLTALSAAFDRLWIHILRTEPTP